MAFATNSSAFGMKSSAPVANNSVFGQKPATGGLFGSQPQGGAFGQPQAQQNTVGGAFGQGQQNQAAGGAFGQPGNAFGQSQQQPATGGLFGQPQQNQQPAAGGSIFGQPQQQQQQQPAGGLFGQPQNQQPAAGGLFGQSQNNQQPGAGGGLFGQSQTQQPTTGGGLFGLSQTQQPAAGGGLFGQSQTQPAAGGGLFGQSQTQAPTGGLFGQNNQQQTGGGLFGASQQNQQPAASGSGLFGAAPPFGASKPAQPGSGLFGGNNNNQQSNLFGNNSTNTNPLFNSNAGGSMFGAKPLQQQQLGLQTSQQGPPPFTKSTKFNDLPDGLKKTLEEIDAHIQGRIQISKDLHQRKLGEEATKGQEMIRGVHKDLVNTTTAIRNDLHFTRDLKAKTDQSVQDTIVATRIVDGFRNPHANAAYLKDHAGFPLEFFTRVTAQMRERLAWYKSTIEQIERKLSSSAGQAQYTPHGIHATLQAQHATFLALASKTAAVDAQLQKIKQIYTQLWKAKTGSHRDPFEVDTTDRADLGFASLNI
ncbi:nucleoporin FG repeat region-domain-containing protein [Mycena rosella]|uniref:Nucleoporin FG repeat region-domain-containing protein n=1 Tax=Mycena rosella TaxID=1033263 RepID=A0AAD7GXQ7_MYCRO|nr:nucleoporin FG repeat region-domain-containing protein [Mycena rosella]